MHKIGVLAAVAAIATACGAPQEPSYHFAPAQEIASPAGENSGEPNWFVAGTNSAFLSWIERGAGDSAALKFAVMENGSWSEPRMAAAGKNWFVNWADFPSLVRLQDGTLAVHWLQKTAKETFAYGIRIAFSRDGGRSWRNPITPHRDGTPTEHGFVSLLPLDGNRMFVAWLDGRKYAAATDGANRGGEMTVRAAVLRSDGTFEREWLLDDRTCDCCQTAAVRVGGKVLVAYRNRSEEEIRDIATVRVSPDGDSEPGRILHPDGWHIPGCPVNGPALAQAGKTVAAAWFTAADDTARVLVSFSMDGGENFTAPVRVDQGAPLGRVDLELLDPRNAVVSWLEVTEDGAEIRFRRVHISGAMDAFHAVALASAARASGFPRMARVGSRLLFSWTDPGPPARVRVAGVEIRRK